MQPGDRLSGKFSVDRDKLEVLIDQGPAGESKALRKSFAC
jgi:hypothetical protein